MGYVFDVASCTKDVIKALEKHNATIWDMKEVFKNTEIVVLLKTPIHAEISSSETQ